MISPTEAGSSAFTSLVNQKSPTESEEEREPFSWRTSNPTLPYSRHFWPVWGPYSPAFSSTAMDRAMKPSSPPLWSLCSFGGAAYPPLLKERLFRFASCSDEEKPSQSYIGLIAEAILSAPEEKLILSDIYSYILTHYPYFRNKGTGWRNSIRHNLSLNDCFVKAGRSPNGKGHFWSISTLYYDDFRRGDFRRRRTQKRSHKHRRTSTESKDEVVICKAESSEQVQQFSADQEAVLECSTTESNGQKEEQHDKMAKLAPEKPKAFDMASLLAPDRGQREGIVFPIIPRPFDGGLVYSPCSPYSSEYFSQLPAYERSPLLHTEPSRLIFPYNYRLAC